MILINLLPPELRRKKRQLDPILAVWVAAMAASLVPVALWAWVQHDRIPNAKRVLEESNEILAQRTSEAEAVEREREQIAAFEQHREMVVGLLSRKVFWARTLNEFVEHMLGPGWQGFEICCTDLQIGPMSGVPGYTGRQGRGQAGESIAYSFRGRFRLLGNERPKAGDYIRAFFHRTEESPFWKRNEFAGKPEATYRGDTPDWRKEVDRVSVDFTLEWARVKPVVTASAKVGK